MTRLRKMMLEELERRNYSESTTRHSRYVERFAQHFGKSPDKLVSRSSSHLSFLPAQGEEVWIREPVECHVSALRFLFHTHTPSS